MSVNLYKKTTGKVFFGVFKNKNMKASGMRVFMLILFAFVFSATSFAATITTAGSGNWSSTVPGAPWPGGIIPAAGDDIVIKDGTTLTVDGNRTCRSIGFGVQGPSAAAGLAVNTGFTLTVTTDVLCPIASVDTKVSATYTLSGGGTINCVNLVTNNTLVPSGSNTTTVTVVSTVSTINVSNNLLIYGTVNAVNKTNNGTFNLRSGTVTVGNAVTTSNVANTNTATLDMVTGAAGATLVLPNADPWDLGNKGINAMNLNGAGATVAYNGSGTQNFVLGTTYNNLTLAGSGNKKIQTGVTVNGTLSMQGTASATNQSPTYGVAATLEYKGSVAQTTSGIEYPLTAGPPNLRIDNPLGVTLDANKSLSGTLTFANGILATGTNKISLGSSATTAGAGPGKYIYGNEEIFFGNTLNPSKTFDIGDATTYAPTTIAFSGTTTGSGSLTASTSAGDHTDINNSGISADTSVNRTWTISKNSIAGFTSYDATFNYAASDLDPGANPANFVIRKLSGTWGTSNLVAANSLSTEANGMTAFGTFQVGQSALLTIDTDPRTHPACLGYSTTFSSTSSSIPTPAIQWQRADNTGIFADITSATDGGVYTNFTSNILTISNIAGLNNYKYRAIFSNINGTRTSAEAILTITIPPSAAISYAGTPFCTTLSSGQPVTQTGTTGGTYSSPTGLTIDGVTGDITPSTSTAGTYTATYTIDAFGGCPTYTSTSTVTITAAPSAGIYYAGNPFCTTVSTAQPVTRTGTTGGTYGSTPGLTINASTGAVTPSTSTPGTYTVTYTVPAANGCAQYTTTTTVTITPAPSATISFAGNPFCASLTGAQPITRTGTTTGIFSSAAGLSIDPTTGDVMPSESTPGSYTMTYTIAPYAGCAAFSTSTPVTISAVPNATISYAGTPFCTSIAGTQPVTFSGTTGGTYSSSAGLSIDPTTGAITPSTSTGGTYTVTYSIGASSGCAAFSTSTTVTITAAPSATILYDQSPFCSSDPTPQSVTITGTAGGTFSSTAGLSIDPSTGDIIPASSTPGTYTVTYSIAAAGGCASFSTTTSVVVTPAPYAIISYTASAFCNTVTLNQPVKRTGNASGSYSSTPGLTLSATTGAIKPSTSTPGTYTVTYTVPPAGGCGAFSATTTVTITAAPSGTISYAGTPFCTTLTSAQPVTQTATPGGIFSAAAGLSIDPATGEITPSASTPGTYTVTYSIAASGGCAAFSTNTSVTITQAPFATISYAGSPFCTSVAGAQPVTRTGTSGGTYSSTPGLTINASSGAITASSSTAGTYTVSYSFAATGGCAAFTATTSVTITKAASATLSYSGAPFCTSVTTAQPATLTGTTGGTFSSAAGLSLNTTTGAITPSTSTPGTYTVTYAVAATGGCAAFSTTATVTITQAPSAVTIAYGGSPFCTSITTAQTVSQTGATGGTYSSSAGLSIKPSTGAITPSTSTPGTYTVTYTIAASGGCAAVSATASVTITAAPSATISYAGSPFCTTVSTGQAVTRTGTAGGTFSSTAGLVINASTGAITPSTSTPGTYTVTYSIAASGGCVAFSTATSVTITQSPSATITYAGTPFCTSVTTAQPVTRTGTAGGTYSSTAGLSINSSTGAITPSSSSPGTYTVTYKIAASGGCAAFSTTTTISITTGTSATISYAGPFCTSVTTAQGVTRTGTTGGTYSSTAGLTINTSTGAITPSTSTPGTYTVSYAVPASAGCGAYTTTASVTITAAASATISYPGSPYCKNLTTAQPVTLTGTAGGTFSSTAGLSINASTGAITPSTSTAGTYTVTYKIAASGGCVAFSTSTSVTITAAPSATISYAASPFCKTVTTAQAATLTGTTGGTYSSTPGLTINTTTGAITPSASTAGTYTVTYTIPASAACAVYTATTSVTITNPPSATISYSGVPFCTSITTAQPVTLTGTAGGTFSSTAGLSIDASTGAITPSASTGGTYTVTYSIAASGGCVAYSTITSVTITAAPSAAINYPGGVLCKSSTTQSVTRTGTAGGTYSSTAGLSLNTTTGAITPSTSTTGTYTVTYSIPASAGCAAYSTTTTVTIALAPTASISYSGSPFCTSISGSIPVTQTGSTGGTYSSTAGLSINAATGDITPSASTAGTYIVTYTIAASGGCSAFATTTTVTIAGGSATISYAAAPFCTSVTTAQAVTRTGTTGGTYSSTTGLILNTSTGAITPSTSTPGTYTVSYTVPAAGGCPPFTATTSVTITSKPSATISYPGTPFCTSEDDEDVTLTGTPGGVYSAPPGVSINSSTGAINPSLSTAGTYTITYTIAASGGCAAISATTSITITQQKTASISYAGSPFCESDNSGGAVTLTGTTGGTFSASPSGLSLTATSGAIKLNKSIRGQYTVSYTIAGTGGCPAYVATTPFNIDQAAVISISYPGTSLCTSTSTPQSVIQTGDVGGTYSATSGLTIDATSGTVTPYPSPAGTYTVTYQVINGCGTYTATTPITLKASPSATISYAGSPFCGSNSTPQPVTRTGTAGGTYSSTAGLTIDANTGAISPFESSPGTYTVSYTVSNGGCTYTTTTTVEIYSASATGISYDATAFCKSVTDEQPVHISNVPGGAFSAPGGLSIDAITGAIIPSESIAGTYTVTYTVPAFGGCTSYGVTTEVTITDIPTASMAYVGSPYCSNGGFASVSLNGTAGGTFSSTAGLSLDTQTGTITLGSSTPGSYTVNYDIPALGGCEALSTSATLAIGLHAVWNGSVSYNWHDANNWSCGGVPTLTSNAIIPSGLSRYPIIYSGTGTTHDLTIQAGASIIDSGALTIAGVIYNSGVIDARAGKVELAATSAETIPSSLFYLKTIQDLVISNPAGVSLTGPLRVTGSVGFGNVNNSVFDTGDSLTLASVATSDACVADVTNAGANFGNVINGFVTVERYMPAKRAYRFLTAPVNSTGSIKQNWMENSINPDRWNRVNPFPGYGTNITGAGDVANGFDPTQTHNPSMFTFNNQTQAWTPIPNTSGLMSVGTPYRIIVRGDRNIDMNTNTPTPTPTTLRATGDVMIGNVSVVKAGAAGGMPYLSANTGAYNLVANPYPSAINWLSVNKTDIGGSIYMFDPTITGSNGRGAYVSYNCTMGMNSNSSSYADNYIQSGQAFFVQTAGPNPSITFKETDKVGLHRAVFRTFSNSPFLSVQLLLPSQQGSTESADGLKVYFADEFSNSIGQEDSYKFTNQDENLGIIRNGNVLSMEGRKPVVEADTIPLKMWQLTQKSYFLKVNFGNFAGKVEAFLEDKYLNLTSPLSTYGETKIPVHITPDAASSAPDRFTIVFKAYATLPLHLLGIKAVEKNNGVEVDWTAESENNMDRYEVEKSPDGQQFVTTGTVKAKANPGPSSSYSWFDLIPFDGDNYYRIKSVDKSGVIKYSSIAKVRIKKGPSAITVFPNPLVGKTITLAFSDIKKGNYSVSLLSSLGEKVYDGTVSHNGGSSNHSIELNKALPSGVYQLLISNNEEIEKIPVLVQ